MKDSWEDGAVAVQCGLGNLSYSGRPTSACILQREHQKGSEKRHGEESRGKKLKTPVLCNVAAGPSIIQN